MRPRHRVVRHFLPLLVLGTCCRCLYHYKGEWTRSLAEGLLAATFGGGGGGMLLPVSAGGTYLAAARPSNAHSSYSGTGAGWLVQLPFSTGSRSCDIVLVHDPELHRCRASAALFWGTDHHPAYGQGPSSPKHTCCFIWSLLDCMERAVRRRCDPYHWETFRRQRLDYVARVQASPICFHYPYGNWHCYLSENWALLLAFAVLAIFILFSIGAALWLFVCRKRCCPGSGSKPATFRDDLFAAEYDVEPRRQTIPRAHVLRVSDPELDELEEADSRQRQRPDTIRRHIHQV